MIHFPSVITAVTGLLMTAFAVASAQEADVADDVTTEPVELVEFLLAEPAQEPFPGIEPFFDGIIGGLMTVHDIPGFTVSVVHEGETVFAKGYGYADVARTRPVSAETTLFRPGSVSKTFTWTAVMQLVEQGKVDLDTDVNEYLTSITIPEAFDAPITLRHILTHTAGFEDGGLGYLFTDDLENLMGMVENMTANMPKRVRAPGTFSSYSNFATALAGVIVADVTGVDFNTYVDQNIFEPLGMNYSTFREPVPEAMATDQSANFDRKGGDYINAKFEYISDYGPAGSMSTTAVDMTKFMIAHLGDGSYGDARILKPETTRLMRERLYENHPAMPAMTYGFYEQFFNGRSTYGHGGDSIYFHTEMTLMPEEEFGVFISTNAPAGGAAARQILPAFFDLYYPAATDFPHPSPDVPETPDTEAMMELSKYAGAYRMNRRSYSTYQKVMGLAGDQVVTVSPRGGLIQGNQRYVPVGNGVFQSVDNMDDKIAFRENDNGEVTNMFVGFPAMAGDKIGPLESAQLHIQLIGLSILVFAGVIIGSLWGFPKWFAMASGEKIARVAVFGGSMLNIVFVTLFGVAVSGGVSVLVFTGIPGLAGLLTLPLLAAVFAVGGAVMAIIAWGQGFWSLFGRIRYTLVVLLLILFAVLMDYWNLLGPWYA